MHSLKNRLLDIIEDYTDDPDMFPYKKLRRSTLGLFQKHLFRNSLMPFTEVGKWDSILKDIRRERLRDHRLEKAVKSFVDNLVDR